MSCYVMLLLRGALHNMLRPLQTIFREVI